MAVATDELDEELLTVLDDDDDDAEETDDEDLDEELTMLDDEDNDAEEADDEEPLEPGEFEHPDKAANKIAPDNTADIQNKLNLRFIMLPPIIILSFMITQLQTKKITPEGDFIYQLI